MVPRAHPVPNFRPNLVCNVSGASMSPSFSLCKKALLSLSALLTNPYLQDKGRPQTTGPSVWACWNDSPSSIPLGDGKEQVRRQLPRRACPFNGGRDYKDVFAYAEGPCKRCTAHGMGLSSTADCPEQRPATDGRGSPSLSAEQIVAAS